MEASRCTARRIVVPSQHRFNRRCGPRERRARSRRRSRYRRASPHDKAEADRTRPVLRPGVGRGLRLVRSNVVGTRHRLTSKRSSPRRTGSGASSPSTSRGRTAGGTSATGAGPSGSGRPSLRPSGRGSARRSSGRGGKVSRLRPPERDTEQFRIRVSSRNQTPP